MTQQRKARKSAASTRARQTPTGGTEEQDGPRLEDRPRMELYEIAKRLEVPGCTEMSKPELIEAIRRR